jgi:predicted RNA-binding protein (virulence factor B family)
VQGELKRTVQQVLTLDEANALTWRKIDAQALDSQAQVVWETIESMKSAQTFNEETLAREISV